MAISTSPLVIPALTNVSSTALIPVGTIVQTTDGGEAMYVTATKTVNQYDAVIIINSSSAAGASIGVVPASTLVAAMSPRLAVAQTALPITTFGWVYTKGNNLRCNVGIACEPAVPLYTSGTPGVLDDTAVSAGYCAGIVAMSSAASASAVPVVCGPMLVETISI